MSETFRKAVSARLPQLPPTRAPWADEPPPTEDDTDDTEELEKGDSMGELSAALPNSSRYASSDLSPLSASSFFAEALEVQPPDNPTIFRVYFTPARSKRGEKGTCLVCHHGGGASGLSFAALAKAVGERSAGELGVVALSCRGHGKTKTLGGKKEDTDLSLGTLLSDFVGVVEHLFPDPKEGPSLVLLGHSMGAAPILSAAPILQSKGYTVPGVVVLDVVEGTAVEALPIMKSILAQRPSSFRSIPDAIHWHLDNNLIRNPTSARVSVPSFLTPAPDQSDPGQQSRQIWRTDLLATEPYWSEWYEGLGKRFLAARCARLLVLAGQERLDKELMVGQMQGKFQLEVMQDVGHYLHEDDPDGLANMLVAFWRRNTRVLILPPKIGSNGSGVEVKRVGQD